MSNLSSAMSRTSDQVCCHAPGARHSPASSGQPKGCPYRSIACAFNQRRLYANLQPADGLAAAAYVFEDAGRWRELAVHAQDIPSFHSTRFDLQVSPHDLLPQAVLVHMLLHKD